MTARDDRLRALKRAHGAVSTGPTPRVEDYVEVIYELILEKGYARIVDISAHLHVSAPTATKMIQKLAEDRLVVYERYRGIALTEAGTELAKRLRERHSVVMDFLRLLDVDEATAHRATEGMEHHLDASTLDRLARLVQHARAEPEWWAQHKRQQKEPQR
ncbi:MAG TPA: transcriptional regulator MntR [Candidatus Thermoplasmatota archaeon]|nr:transcriptional regulator MntR [Candidatus Thermoplasmatota archaeon]